eukprot:jgi/Botrbrau1/20989/Bobra.0144s0008.1
MAFSLAGILLYVLQKVVIYVDFLEQKYRDAGTSIFSFFANVYNRLPSSVSNRLERLGTMVGLELLDINDIGQPPPAPTVIAIIAAGTDQEDLAFMRFLKILTWCFQNGVQYIFLYDPAGYLHRFALVIKKELAKELHKQVSVKVGYEVVGDGVAADGPEEDLCLHMLSSRDTVLPLVLAARQLSIQVSTPDDLSEAMVAVCGPAAIMEPALALVVGPVLTLAGYPPWPLSFTQIYHVGVLRKVTKRVLERTFRQYKVVFQRYGT